MGIRETLEKNKKQSTIVAAAVTVLAFLFVIWQVSSWFGSDEMGPPSDQAYFSSDDGATWFAADITEIPPITGPDGKPAYRAHVYEDQNGKFVGWLETYDPKVKEQLVKLMQENDPKKSDQLIMLRQMNSVKLPGKPDWYPAMSGPGKEISSPYQRGEVRGEIFP